MARLLTCPKGHQWDAAKRPNPANVCPSCGAVVVVPAAPVSSSATSLKSATAVSAGLPPSQGVSRTVPLSAKEAAAVPPPATVPGYEILGMLGRGGMGVVYKARHHRLNRLVALKMILAGAHAHPEELARFRSEGEAVAHLQHPNIVQIYEVGEHNALPYFALEYVDGGSLKQRLTGQPVPARQAAQLMETLARAMHHAHQNGIVHRDLKPGNILLQAVGKYSGGFGIPKVADFGLAKDLDKDSTQTKTGNVLGTPSYIAPEQAAGKTREVGPQADVYALGAMLYELLTGRPPFQGESAMDTILMVLSEEPVPPSQRCSKVNRDLETICLKCLEKQPGKRYADAEALAVDLRHYLDGEPIQARPVSAPERLWRWCRRRPVVAGLLALLVLVMLGGFVGVFWQWRRAEEQRGIAVASLKEAQQQRDEAEKQRHRAEENFRQARQAVDEYFNQVSRNRLLDVPGLQPLRRELLESALKYYRTFLQQHGDDADVQADLAAAFLHVAMITQALGSRTEALAACQQAQGLYEKLARREPDNLKYQDGLATCWRLSGNLQYERGQLTEALRSLQKSRDLLLPLVRKEPGNVQFQKNLALSHGRLGLVHRSLGQLTEALRALHEARDILERLMRAHPTDEQLPANLAGMYSTIGHLQRSLGRPAEAQQAFQRCCDLLQPIVQAHPQSIEDQRSWLASLSNLAVALRDAGKLAESQRGFQQVRDLLDALVRANPNVVQYQHDLAQVCISLGAVQSAMKHQAEALRSLQQASDLYAQLIKTDAKVLDYQRGLAACYSSLALVQLSLGQPAEALRLHQQSRDLFQQLIRANPAVPQLQSDLARAHNNMGSMYSETGKPAEALRSFQDAKPLLEKLVSTSPDVLEYRYELGRTLHNIGDAQRTLGRLDEAATTYQLAVDQLKVAVGKAAQVQSIRRHLSATLTDLGQVQRTLGRPAAAAAVAQDRRRLWPNDAGELYSAAAELAQCIPLVAKGKAQPTSQEQAEQRQYAEQAVNTLRQAIQAGFKDVNRLRSDAALAPLRSRDDFKRLLSDLERVAGR